MWRHRDRRATTPWPSLRPAACGRLEKGTGYVGALVRATSPPFALLLAGALLQTILSIADIEYRP